MYIPRKASGVGNGNPLQYSCLGNMTGEEPGGLQSTGLQRVGDNRAPEHRKVSRQSGW